MYWTKDLEKLIDEFRQRSQEIVDLEKQVYYALTYHSTAIEGSTLTEHEVWELLDNGKSATDKPIDHNLMVQDHYQAILFIVEAANKQEPVTPGFLKSLCAKVMHSTGGIVNTVLGVYNTAAGDFRLNSVRACYMPWRVVLSDLG